MQIVNRCMVNYQVLKVGCVVVDNSHWYYYHELFKKRNGKKNLPLFTFSGYLFNQAIINFASYLYFPYFTCIILVIYS